MKRKFNPEKNVHENTNQSRMLSASQSLAACRKYSPRDTDSIRDLIADLLHYADSEDMNAHEILKDAIGNWRAER